MCDLIGGAVLVIQKFIVMSEKVGYWHGIRTDILRIAYPILHILISKSVLVFFTFAPSLSLPTLPPLPPLLRNLPTFILVRTSVYPVHSITQPFWRHYGQNLRKLQILEHFHFHAVLLTRHAWQGMRDRSCRTTSNILSSSLKKGHL